MRGPGIGWLVEPTLKATEGSRLKMVGLDALLTYRRVVAWFPGTVDDTGHYFLQLRRLNQGVDTNHWRVYDHKEECNGACTVLSIESTSVTVLERMGWRQFSSGGKAIFSLLGVRPEGVRKRQRWRRRRWLNVTVSTILFIQAKSQHSIASSREHTTTAVVKGIDMALIGEPWYREGRSIGPIIRGYTIFHGWNR